MAENTINTELIEMKEGIGSWFYANKLLKDNKISETSRNKYQIMTWLEKNNKIKEHFIEEGASILIPKTCEDIKSICHSIIKENIEKKENIEDSYPIEYPELKLYETDHKPGKNSDGSDADDMKVNDFDDEHLIKHNSMFKYEIQDFNINYNHGTKGLIARFKIMVELFFTRNKELRNVVLKQIDNFVSTKPKKEFVNDTLSQYAKNHASTRKLVDKVKIALTTMLKEAKGDISQVCYIDAKKGSNTLKRELHWGTDLSKDWTPAFSSSEDQNEGLKIAVNDVWGYTISVKDFVLNPNGKYSCTLFFSMFDHFGLNEEDFHKGKLGVDYWAQTGKKILAGFRAWFFLQHYTGFEGKYKPFITRMNFEEKFDGEL